MSADLAGAAVMVRAYIAGRRAGRDGRPVTSCPFDPVAAGSVERAQARMWLRGYDRERPFPIDWTG